MTKDAKWPVRDPASWTVDTKCCGTITRCEGECGPFMSEFAGAAKCIHCKWIWKMRTVPDIAITPAAMKRAHN